MTDEKKKMTAQGSSVGADDGQSISQNSKTTIPDPGEKSNSPERDLEELYRRMRRMSDPAYLHTVTLDELMDNVFEGKSAVIENLLYTGAYILAGAPKIGKSFLVAQIAHHVSTWQDLWGYKVHQGTVLYLALEDDESRLQRRMFRMFGVEGTSSLHFATNAKMIGGGLDEQLEKFVREHSDTRLIIVDTLQKVREAVSDSYSYSIYNPVNMAPIGLENSIQQLNVLLSKLESKRQEFVDAIQRRKAILRDLLLINKKIAHLQIGQAYRDYLKQQREMSAAEAKLQTKQKEVNETSEHLKALELQKSNVGLAIENINNALDYVFFSHGRLSIELKNDKYYLKSNGNDVKPKSVSLGERNIIALCYFFTQILSNQDIGRLYQDEELVVIDDPISSFDFENKVGISSFLRYQTHKIIKGNAKSKILFLTHDLSTFSDLQKIADEMEKSFKKQKLGVSVKGRAFDLIISGTVLSCCQAIRKPRTINVQTWRLPSRLPLRMF